MIEKVIFTLFLMVSTVAKCQFYYGITQYSYSDTVGQVMKSREECPFLSKCAYKNKR